MNVTSDNHQLTRNASENNVNVTDFNAIKKSSKQQKTNGTAATIQSERMTDTVQISKTGAELSRASNATGGISSMGLSTDNRSEDKRVSAGGIESVMARYKEAQNFMAQIESGSINSTV